MNVFDFDNTIYDGESAVDFFLFYLKRKPGLIRYLPMLLAALVKYKRGKLGIDEALSQYGPLVTKQFLQMENRDTLIREFWDTHEKNIRPFYESVRSEKDLILSCSPEISLAEICTRLGISRFIGTAIDPDSGKITRLCFRENKVRAFLEQYPGSRIDTLYTDSENDAPLMALSDNVLLVKGKRITKIK